MAPLCDRCCDHIHKLNQQVSVMRKEIKNLRQMLDGAVRAHRKHLISVEAAVSKIGLSRDEKDQTPPPPSPSAPSAQTALEQGNIQTVPIGYISSCFSMKNGTPRQPTICGPSRAELRIQQSVFNNPDHALVGLEQYSHVCFVMFCLVFVVFVFFVICLMFLAFCFLFFVVLCFLFVLLVFFVSFLSFYVLLYSLFVCRFVSRFCHFFWFIFVICPFFCLIFVSVLFRVICLIFCHFVSRFCRLRYLFTSFALSRIIFLFHKNGHLSYKAKVKPPRLNGQRVGVYSTRSPHRPNALGLTLAKLDKIEGDRVHLSDIDMIAGTPVLDIKPYIPEYDSPDTRMNMDSEPYDSNSDQPNSASALPNEETNVFSPRKHSDTDAQLNIKGERTAEEVGSLLSANKSETDHPSGVNAQFSLPKDLCSVLEEVKAYVTQDDICQVSCESNYQVSDPPQTRPSGLTADHPCFGEEAYTTIAGWIREPPVASLDVRFTPHAERELAEFLPTHLSGNSESDRPRFKFLRSPEEAAAAIRGVLSADPRSVYRRTRCRDRLFFFTLDTADITCWFGRGFAEVVQVRPVECEKPFQ